MKSTKKKQIKRQEVWYENDVERNRERERKEKKENKLKKHSSKKYFCYASDTTGLCIYLIYLLILKVSFWL